MAHSPRGWTGARTPSAIKRVRQTQRRRAINQPRRTAARTLVNRAVVVASNGDAEQAQEALVRAISALDRAAKSGVIHRNAAARRKSRLSLKVAAALGGAEIVTGTKVGRTTGKAAAAKQAKARIAASKATKAKGAQTAAGKSRAAIARSTREQGPTAPAAQAEAPAKAPATAEAPAKAPEKSAGGGTRSRAKGATRSTGEGKPAAKPRASRAKKQD